MISKTELHSGLWVSLGPKLETSVGPNPGALGCYSREAAVSGADDNVPVR